LEAFAKFGSDLDASTKLTIERGKRNLEMLKQPNGAPQRVEEQVAMIFLSTKGLLDNVAVSKIRAFEKDFVNVMNATQKSTMEALKAGKFDDSLTDVLTKISKEVAPKYA